MKRVLAVLALAGFALAPASGMACDYSDAMKSAESTPAPAATTPAAEASKAAAAKAVVAPVKQVASKTKAPVTDQKLAASTIK